MGKNYEMAMLLDFYGDLLTEKQAQALELYYNEDLSLAEIAAPLGITRQGVRDSIKRGEAQLIQLENTLGLARRFREAKQEMQTVSAMFAEVNDYIKTYIHSDKLAGATEAIAAKLEDVTKLL